MFVDELSDKRNVLCAILGISALGEVELCDGVVETACGLDAVDVDIDVFVAGLFDLRHFGGASALRSLERAASS